MFLDQAEAVMYNITDNYVVYNGLINMHILCAC